ncbi:hypothetical protein M0805_003112 [Coniferiporia weirii]|nr:hypothetical protein M0805_003112 [Coniferiporia weirii]
MPATSITETNSDFKQRPKKWNPHFPRTEENALNKVIDGYSISSSGFLLFPMARGYASAQLVLRGVPKPLERRYRQYWAYTSDVPNTDDVLSLHKKRRS